MDFAKLNMQPTRDSPGETSALPSPFTSGQVRLLKIAVIGMGLVLLLGFATVIGRIVYLVNSSPSANSAAVRGAERSPLAPWSVTLPKGAVVRHMALSSDRLAIHFESPSGAGIRVIELNRDGEGITLRLAEEEAR